MFVQIAPPQGSGPVWISGVRGHRIGDELLAISSRNPYPAYLIGLVESAVPHEAARKIAEQFVQHHMHDGWFEATPQLLQFIQHSGQHALSELLAVTRPGGIDDQIVDVDGIAAILGVSARTIYRLVDNDGIPHMRVGKQLRFSVSDVLAAMNLR
jgi:excisionase family DNA binding protein